MSDTPRTDAKAWRPDIGPYAIDVPEEVPAAFARKLERENTRLRDALEKCFWHLGEEIKHKTLNESAADGTQALSQEVAKVLDAAKKT